MNNAYKIIRKFGYYFSALLFILGIIDAVWYKTWYMISEGLLVAILFAVLWTFLIRVIYERPKRKM